jgi:molybdopterin synthase catalytic subunit
MSDCCPPASHESCSTAEPCFSSVVLPPLALPKMELVEGPCYAEVSPDALDLLKYSQIVADPGAGAIATFTGVTRDNFQGKQVEKLEYEAYVPMAVKKLLVGNPACNLFGTLQDFCTLIQQIQITWPLLDLQEVCSTACSKWDLIKIAIAHRTGLVRVGEASVIIAASSAHRGDALEVRGSHPSHHSLKERYPA